MPYGKLSEFAQSGIIDFGRVGTGEIDLTTWKYYNEENQATLTFGLDIYPEENKGVAEVVLEFYDNNGIAAALHLNNKSHLLILCIHKNFEYYHLTLYNSNKTHNGLFYLFHLLQKSLLN